MKSRRKKVSTLVSEKILQQQEKFRICLAGPAITRNSKNAARKPFLHKDGATETILVRAGKKKKKPGKEDKKAV